MTFQIHNFFNVYLQKILLIYTELWKKKVESKRNKYIEKKILTQVHPISKNEKKRKKEKKKRKRSKINTTQIRYK